LGRIILLREKREGVGEESLLITQKDKLVSRCYMFDHLPEPEQKLI